MRVTVNPIQTINVRVNSQNAPRVTGTSVFYGSGSYAQEAQLALQLAQSASDSANTALLAVGNKVDKAGDTMSGDLTIVGDITANNAYLTQTYTLIDGGTFS